MRSAAVGSEAVKKCYERTGTEKPKIAKS